MNKLGSGLSLQAMKRRLRWKPVLFVLSASIALHLGILFILRWIPVSPRLRPPPDHLQVEYFKLPRKAAGKPDQPDPAARSSVAESPRAKKMARPRKPLPRKAAKQEIAERIDPVSPSESVIRPKLPSIVEMIRSQIPAPPPPVVTTVTNRDATYVKYSDGSVTLRSPELARSVAGARIDDRIQVQDGRILDGSDSAEAIGKRLASQLPHLGVHSPRGVDLGRMDWYAKRLASTCGIYTEDRSASAPHGVYILIDSSGSMQENLYTSPATTCGYSVALSALEASTETRVGVINFSSMNHVVGETRDVGRITDGITRAVGGDTYLPGRSIRKLVRGGGRKDIVVITDSHIRNYEHSLPHFKDVLARDPRNQGILIVIGDERATNSAAVRRFIWAGFKVRHHARFKLDDLPDRRPRPRPYRFSP